MEELIFFAVIIFFSIIESIARSRKKRSGPPQIPEEWEPEEPREWRPERARTEWRTERPRETATTTYDSDPSYDDVDVDEAADSRETPPDSTRPYGTTRAEGPRGSGSEGMIPSDIWEEIAGLARGRQPQMEPPKPAPQKPAPPAPVAAPKLPPSTPAPAARDAWGKRTPRVGQHRVHLAHAGYGTDPSSRAPSTHDGLDPLAQRLSRDVRAVRKQIRGGRHALRQAVILQEVLGPPASMRSEPLLE